MMMMMIPSTSFFLWGFDATEKEVINSGAVTLLVKATPKGSRQEFRTGTLNPKP